jgi:hypothetical protein
VRGPCCVASLGCTFDCISWSRLGWNFTSVRINTQKVRLLWRCWWRFQSQVGLDYREGGGSNLLRNVCTYIPDHTTLRAKRLRISAFYRDVFDSARFCVLKEILLRILVLNVTLCRRVNGFRRFDGTAFLLKCLIHLIRHKTSRRILFFLLHYCGKCFRATL